MRVVFDTVVVVRALINPAGRWGRLIFERGDSYITIVSPEILREMLDVINRPKLLKRFAVTKDAPQMQILLSKLAGAVVVEPSQRINICRDPKDDKFLECAVEGRANYIVSEDKDLLDVEEHAGVRIVSAMEFLELISK